MLVLLFLFNLVLLLSKLNYLQQLLPKQIQTYQIGNLKYIEKFLFRTTNGFKGTTRCDGVYIVGGYSKAGKLAYI